MRKDGKRVGTALAVLAFLSAGIGSVQADPIELSPAILNASTSKGSVTLEGTGPISVTSETTEDPIPKVAIKVSADTTGGVGESSTSLVTGSQVWKAISDSAYTAGDHISITDKKISVLTGEVSSSNNDLVTGAKVAEAFEANKYKAGTYISIADDRTISVTADGSITNGDTGLVTGDAVYDYLHGNTTAIGEGASATGERATAIGASSLAEGTDATALGDSSALGINATALGRGNMARGESATAVGTDNSAEGKDASAVGFYNIAKGKYTASVGYGNNVNSGSADTESYSTAMGSGNTATGALQSSAVGIMNKATANTATAFGKTNTVSAGNSAAFGISNTAGSDGANYYNASAFGISNEATADYASAYGYLNKATAVKSAAFGYRNTASGEYASAFGYYNTASGKGGSVFGYYNAASALASVAVGAKNEASNKYASAVGGYNKASGENSNAFGQENNVSGENSSAFGYKNTVTAANATVIGNQNTVTAADAFVLGSGVTTVAENSVVLGKGSTSEDSNTVSVGTTGKERKIVHVADGTVNTDAATWGQIVKAGQTLSFETTTGDNATNVIKNNKGDVLVTVEQGEVAQNNKKMVSGGQVWDEDVKEDQTISLAEDGNKLLNNKNETLATFQKMEAVAAGDNGFVSGDDLYTEVRPEDGVYVANSMTTGENLKSLDDGLVETNERLDRVGAGAAALAALHPEDFNAEDKWSFAAGYGHYKNANAGAFGIFYKPNADTTFSIASTIGNGNTMMNAGVSFKLGQRGAAIAHNPSNAALAQEVKDLRAENEELRAKIAQIMEKLEMSETVEKSAK